MPITEYETCSSVDQAKEILGHDPTIKPKGAGGRKRKSASQPTGDASAPKLTQTSCPQSSCASTINLNDNSNVPYPPVPNTNNQAFIYGAPFDPPISNAASEPLPPERFAVQQWNVDPTANFNSHFSAYVPGSGQDGCGCASSETCGCLGCATHPDNPATLEHVNNATNFMSEWYNSGSSSSDRYSSTASTYFGPSSEVHTPFIGADTPQTSSPITGNFSSAANFGSEYFPTGAPGAQLPIPAIPPTFTSSAEPVPSVTQVQSSGSNGSASTVTASGWQCPQQNPTCRCHTCYCQGCLDHYGCNGRQALRISVAEC